MDSYSFSFVNVICDQLNSVTQKSSSFTLILNYPMQSQDSAKVDVTETFESPPRQPRNVNQSESSRRNSGISRNSMSKERRRGTPDKEIETLKSAYSQQMNMLEQIQKQYGKKIEDLITDLDQHMDQQIEIKEYQHNLLVTVGLEIQSEDDLNIKDAYSHLKSQFQALYNGYTSKCQLLKGKEAKEVELNQQIADQVKESEKLKAQVLELRQPFEISHEKVDIQTVLQEVVFKHDELQLNFMNLQALEAKQKTDMKQLKEASEDQTKTIESLKQQIEQSGQELLAKQENLDQLMNQYNGQLVKTLSQFANLDYPGNIGQNFDLLAEKLSTLRTSLKVILTDSQVEFPEDIGIVTLVEVLGQTIQRLNVESSGQKDQLQRIPELVAKIDTLENELNGVREFVQNELQSPRETSEWQSAADKPSLVEVLQEAFNKLRNQLALRADQMIADQSQHDAIQELYQKYQDLSNEHNTLLNQLNELVSTMTNEQVVDILALIRDHIKSQIIDYSRLKGENIELKEEMYLKDFETNSSLKEIKIAREILIKVLKLDRSSDLELVKLCEQIEVLIVTLQEQAQQQPQQPSEPKPQEDQDLKVRLDELERKNQDLYQQLSAVEGRLNEDLQQKIAELEVITKENQSLKKQLEEQQNIYQTLEQKYTTQQQQLLLSADQHQKLYDNITRNLGIDQLDEESLQQHQEKFNIMQTMLHDYGIQVQGCEDQLKVLKEDIDKKKQTMRELSEQNETLNKANQELLIKLQEQEKKNQELLSVQQVELSQQQLIRFVTKFERSVDHPELALVLKELLNILVPRMVENVVLEQRADIPLLKRHLICFTQHFANDQGGLDQINENEENHSNQGNVSSQILIIGSDLKKQHTINRGNRSQMQLTVDSGRQPCMIINRNGISLQERQEWKQTLLGAMNTFLSVADKSSKLLDVLLKQKTLHLHFQRDLDVRRAEILRLIEDLAQNDGIDLREPLQQLSQLNKAIEKVWTENFAKFKEFQVQRKQQIN